MKIFQNELEVLFQCLFHLNVVQTMLTIVHVLIFKEMHIACFMNIFLSKFKTLGHVLFTFYHVRNPGLLYRTPFHGVLPNLKGN